VLNDGSVRDAEASDGLFLGKEAAIQGWWRRRRNWRGWEFPMRHYWWRRRLGDVFLIAIWLAKRGCRGEREHRLVDRGYFGWCFLLNRGGRLRSDVLELE
jgi:hypothetical protein